MNFIDTVLVDAKAGDGGNGHVSFRQEKFVDRGGPDGGDGGRGGHIIFRASRNQNTLAAFRYQREVRAEPGQAGSMRRKHGRNGKDKFVDLPVGTVISTEDGAVLADLTEDGQEAIICKGGRGGFGNAHFVSSVRQAPGFAENGEDGDAMMLRLEIKLIADIGLIGLPNAGKSTLLGAISNARPEIADYPFTTIRPNLGVVDVDDSTSLLVADIPGLIEGAAEGKGLGHEFLRHVERTKVMIHLIDAYNDDVVLAYNTIQDELRSYKVDLTDRPQLVVLNKIDGLDQEIIDDLIKQLRAAVPEGTVVTSISAQAGTNVKAMLFAVKATLAEYKEKYVEEVPENFPTLRLTDLSLAWRVSKGDDGSFFVTGHRIEKFAQRTNFDNEEGVARLMDIMRKMGIIHELKRQGVETGQTIRIGKSNEFKY